MNIFDYRFHLASIKLKWTSFEKRSINASELENILKDILSKLRKTISNSSNIKIQLNNKYKDNILVLYKGDWFFESLYRSVEYAGRHYNPNFKHILLVNNMEIDIAQNTNIKFENSDFDIPIIFLNNNIIGGTLNIRYSCSTLILFLLNKIYCSIHIGSTTRTVLYCFLYKNNIKEIKTITDYDNDVVDFKILKNNISKIYFSTGKMLNVEITGGNKIGYIHIAPRLESYRFGLKEHIKHNGIGEVIHNLIKLRKTRKVEDDSVQDMALTRLIKMMQHDDLKRTGRFDNLQDRFIFFVSKWFTAYDSSWIRPLGILVIVTFFFSFLPIEITGNTLEQPLYNTAINKYFLLFFHLLNPLAKIKSNCAFLYGLTMVYKVLYAFLVYETIKVFRRFNNI